MKRSLESLVADIADGAPVDLRKHDDTAGTSGLEREFGIIAALRTGAVEQPERTALLRVADTLTTAAVALATFRVLVALAVALLIGKGGLHLGIALIFAIAGLTCLIGANRDARAASLGAVFTLIAGAFVMTYLRIGENTVLRALAVPGRLLASDAFLPLALWQFVCAFPNEPRTAAERRYAHAGVAAALVVGACLLILDVSVMAGWELVPGWSLSPSVKSAVYWPPLFLVAAPALGYLLWKVRRATLDERQRVALLALWMVAAVGGFVVMGLWAVVNPALVRGPASAWIGTFLYTGLLSLIPAACYAVFVQQVFNLHFVIQAAVKRALARNVVLTGMTGSLLYVSASLYAGREQPLSVLLRGNGVLITVAVCGLVALTFRERVLHWIDHWFEHGPLDYAEAMSRLGAWLKSHRDMRDLHQALARELVRSLGVESASILVLNERGDAFVRIDGGGDALAVSSVLAGMLRASREGLPVSRAAGALLLLPQEDRNWLQRIGATWLIPMAVSSERLLGVVCLGRRATSELSAHDIVVASAMVDQVALRMDYLAIRHRQPDSDGAPPSASGPDWRNERALQCTDCGEVVAAGRTVCACEGSLEPAALPLNLNGKFRVERVLGRGGMSVVYRAQDLALNRPVALKAMPTVTPRHMARLAREGKAMASVMHPNVATVHGIESWRDAPVIVMECLDGGTLADALRMAPLDVPSVLDLGIVLADALDRMHTSGWLHRDIKPSNIGYTVDGVPTLLDFGLAAVLEEQGGPGAAPARVGAAQALAAHFTAADWSAGATGTVTHQFAGTPLYMPPEAQESQEPSASFDLWALALVLYEALAGQHPFAGHPTDEVLRRVRSVRIPDVRDFRPECPKDLAAFLNDALALAGDRRPASAASFRQALQALRASGSSRA